jgi:hypothetical protein
MADFCKQCSIDNFGDDYGDHKGHSTAEDTKNGLFATVICEGCGFVQVDHDGNCVTKDCLEHHGEQC